MTDNLFTCLFQWARRQDENFVTEAFAYLLFYLCRHDWGTTQGFVQRLCFGNEGGYQVRGPPAISTQVREAEGQPDIQLCWPDAFVLVEVKKGSGVGAAQVQRYREILNRSAAAVKRLVLLTLLPFEAGPDGHRPDEHLYWCRCS